jgi:ABC-2 type transport system ATP-binding protein
LIEVTNLTKVYGSHPAVADISFRAERGEILGLLGPNGAGKTTTMRILTCFLPPTSGSARIAGFDVLDDSLEVRRRIGYFPENVPVYRDLSVKAYLDFVGKLKGMPRPKRARRIAEVMEECGIGDVQTRTIGKLSKGYRQRVGLAQALLNDPEILILDEPTVGLDPRQVVEIRSLIRNLSGQRTIILSTHILPEVSVLCQRVIIMNKGRLIIDDTPDNMKDRLRRSMSVDLVIRGEAEQVIPFLQSLPQVRSATLSRSLGPDRHSIRLESADNSDIREMVARRIIENGFGLLGMTGSELSLEDIFMHLVTEEREL